MVEETLASMDATSKESALDYIEILNLQAAISFRTVHHLSTWIGERIHNRIIVNYIAGRGALDRALEIGREQNNKAAQAGAEQHIGDWHLLFGRRSAAAVHYKRAQRLAQEADITLFDKPRRLPGFVNVTNPGRASTPNGGHVNYVRTRFDIDRQGRARNVTILEVNPAGKTRLAQEARVQLRGTRFRPRFEGGKAVESKGVEIRFVFPHAEARGAQGATS